MSDIVARLREEYGRKRDHRPNPRRITQALDLRGLQGPDVDVACGAVEPAVDEWEEGTSVPTVEQLAKLAALTRFPVGFFYQADPPPLRRLIVCEGRKCTVIEREPRGPLAQVTPLFKDTLW